MAIPCKTCDSGTMEKKKVYRLSGCVVGIGYLLLIPGVLGALFSLLVVLGAIGAASDGHTQDDLRARLVAVSVPELIIESALTVGEMAPGQLNDLTDEQKDEVETVHKLVVGEAFLDFVGIMAGGMAVGMLIMSIIGSLLGWLLIMKKRILQCGSCGAVVAAS